MGRLTGMIAVNTSILVYAHRRDADFHEAAAAQLKRLAEGRPAWVHDARIAALCVSHGVRELCSADRDFGRFASSVTVRNPLVG